MKSNAKRISLTLSRAFEGEAVKRELQKFERNLSVRADMERFDISQGLNNSNLYLRALVNELTVAENTEAKEYEVLTRTLYVLAVYCRKPNFLFKKNHKKWHELFRSEECCVSSNVDEYVNKLKLCCHYIRRGTTDLDRQASITYLSNEKIERLADKIFQIYTIYWDLLKKSRVIPVHTLQPKVNQKLLENCLTKHWLLPVAHIILLRDAQEQLQGRKKYKDEMLLKPNGISENTLSGLCESENLLKATLVCAYQIRIAVAEFVRDNENATDNIDKDCYRDEAKMRESQMEKLLACREGDQMSPLSTFYALSFISYNLNKRDNYKVPHEQPFPILMCNSDLIALRIANAHDLSLQQTQLLIEILPKLLWERTNIEKKLNNKAVFGELISSLSKEINAFRDCLTPTRYYSIYGRNNFKTFHNAIKIIGEIGSKSKAVEKGKSDREIVLSFASFFDPTRIVLMVSGAYCPNTKSLFLMPEFIQKQIRHLRKSLKKYRSEKYISRLLNKRGGYVESEGDQCLVGAIRKTVALAPCYETTYMELQRKMTWENAKEFLEKYLINQGMNDILKDFTSTDYVQPIYTDYKKQWFLPVSAEQLIKAEFFRVSVNVVLDKLVEKATIQLFSISKKIAQYYTE